MALTGQISLLATRVATEIRGVWRAKQPAAPRWTNFRTRTAGQAIVTGTLSDDGTPFLVSTNGTETATVANGRLEVGWASSAGAAYYLQQNAGGTIKRIGATFGFGPSANTTSGSVALATWTTDYPTGGVTSAQVHLAMTASSATFGVVVSGSVINLVNWPYAAALAQDWTPYTAEVVVSGSTAFCLLPDGSSRSITDSRIGSTAGYTATWEFFRDAGTTTVPIAFYDVWASTYGPTGGLASAADMTRATLRGLAEVAASYARIQIPTSVKTAAYTAAMNEIVMVDATAGPITITLPAIAGPGRISVKKVDTTANVVTVVSTGSNTIGSAGAVSVPVRYQDQTTTFQANSTPNPANWVVPYNHLSPAALASVYAPFTHTHTPTAATITYAATITPDAAASVEQRVVATGALAVNLPANGVDGQYLLLWVQASGGARTVTMNASYEVSQPVPGRVFTIPAGTWGSVLARNRGGTWVLMAAAPQSLGAPSTPITYAATITPDAATGSQFHCTATGNVIIAAPTNPTDGQRLMVEVMASGANRTVTISGTTSNASGATLAATVLSGKSGFFGFVYSPLAGHWILLAVILEP